MNAEERLEAIEQEIEEIRELLDYLENDDNRPLQRGRVFTLQEKEKALELERENILENR